MHLPTRRLTATLGSYLRATASYTDNEGSEKSAMVVSDYAVQGIRGANAAPMFLDDDVVMWRWLRTPERCQRTRRQVRPLGTRLWPRTKMATTLTYTLRGDGRFRSVVRH